MTFVDRMAERLTLELARRDVPQVLIEAAIESGYMYHPTSPNPSVADTFYLPKGPSGVIPIDHFAAFLKGEQDQPKLHDIPDYGIHSLDEAKAILERQRHIRYRDRMCFRGQTKEYRTVRKLPNLVRADSAGRERLIIPAFWRQFQDDWLDRFTADVPRSIFTTFEAEELIYWGIPNVDTLAQRNFDRHGVHTMSDLEDFPDSESQEYGRRWRQHKVDGPSNSELPLIEQHYGMKTMGLDVTFDLATALFFASQEFKRREDETATFVPVPDGAHEGVVYAMVFRDPPLRRTDAIVTEIGVFEHLPPERPIRQQCALPGFDAFGINAAVTDLDAVFYLAPDFNPAGLPLKEHLFPGERDDQFYEAVLAVKRGPRGAWLSDIVEYRFDEMD
ncbi:MAG: FRG domain-containing protein [Chloroflexi bacterium]|nr:FRG domain-containing protein [Chloroflexota bacterium]